MENLLLYSIMPLDISHIDDICEDIRLQLENGVATYPLFKMTLVPEGNPPVDKVGVMCEKYLVFKKKLDSMGIKSGVLMQATLGHGWKLSELSSFQRYEGIRYWDDLYTYCPNDDGFCEYIKDAAAQIASCSPCMIMVDDDFRLIYRGEKGCACPLHMKEFNRIAGTSFTRDELAQILRKPDLKAVQYSEIFVETQKSSLVKAAKAIRTGIDRVDKTIPGAYCSTGNNAEFAADIVKELAGEGNPLIVRINNASYLTSSGRFFSNVFQRAACQVERLKGKVDYILAETDTCPQTRHSTSAAILHAHFTGSILEGTKGAKQWITPMVTFDDVSGKAYRNTLSKYRYFYQKLAEITDGLKYRGCRIPLVQKPVFDYTKLDEYGYGFDETDNWSKNVLERLGLPLFFSSEKCGAVFMEGDADKKFDDSEILEMFKGPVFLASDTAKRLADRGFLEYIGVSVSEWNGEYVKRELMVDTKDICSGQDKVKQLTLDDEDAYADSMACACKDEVNVSVLFPATTVFKNKLGGTTVVFAGSPDVEFGLNGTFSFLNQIRKKQLVRLLRSVSCLPVYYTEDADVYLKAADMEDGGLFCAVFNLGLDLLESLPLCADRDIKEIYILNSDGEKEKVAFELNDGVIDVKVNAKALEPVILMMY